VDGYFIPLDSPACALSMKTFLPPIHPQ